MNIKYDWPALQPIIVEQLKQGKPCTTIAKQIGCDQSLVYNKLKEWQIDLAQYHRTVIPTDRVDEARAFLAAGNDGTMLAEAWGHDRGTIYRWLRLHGITYQRPRYNKTPIGEVQAMIDLHDSTSMSQEQIGLQFGRSQSEVSRLFRRYGKKCMNRPKAQDGAQ